jgi:hypothetical protein
MDDEYINLYAKNIGNMDAMYSIHAIIAFQVFISMYLCIFYSKKQFLST